MGILETMWKKFFIQEALTPAEQEEQSMWNPILGFRGRGVVLDHRGQPMEPATPRTCLFFERKTELPDVEDLKRLRKKLYKVRTAKWTAGTKKSVSLPKTTAGQKIVR